MIGLFIFLSALTVIIGILLIEALLSQSKELNETEITQMLNAWKQEQATKEIDCDHDKLHSHPRIYGDYECSTDLEGLTKGKLETWLKGLTAQIDTEMVSILKNGTSAEICMLPYEPFKKVVCISFQGEQKQKEGLK